MINIPKGTKDMLPNESFKWRHVYRIIDNLTKKYNIKEIATPTFESTELFVRGAGEGSDIVNKEMYTFLDKGERSITLKPEGTAGVVRSFIENGLFNNPLPLKVYYKTPCFRYEKPQAWRLREHHQFGVEMFGSDNVESEVEIFMFLNDFFRSFDITPTFSINYLGCSECSQRYKNLLRDFVKPNLKNFCSDCNNRYNKNVLRMLDCKVDSCKELLQCAPRLADNLCESCSAKFNKIKKSLDNLNIAYIVDTNLVRGLDYYTGTVFEILNITQDQGQVALGGGGRYNNLVEELGGKPTPVIGFGIGLERLMMYLDSVGYKYGEDDTPDIYIASAIEDSTVISKLASNIRQNGYSVEYDLMGRGLKAQFKYADKLNVKFVIVIGEDEVNNKTLTIKNMQQGIQDSIKQEELINYLEERL